MKLSALPDEASFLEKHQQHDFTQSGWWHGLADPHLPVWTRLAHRPGWGGVHFYWSSANASTTLAGVGIEVHSHTPHPLSATCLMQKLPQSEVWYWRTELPLDWIGSYQFIPMTEGQTRPASASQAQLRQWWQGLLASMACADQFSAYPAYPGVWGGQLAQLLGPEASCFTRWHQQARLSRPGYYSEAGVWSSARRQQRYAYSAYYLAQDATVCKPAAAQAACLVLHLDGERWLTLPDYLPALASLHQQDGVQSAWHVFLSSAGSQQRSADYACNAEFIEALAKEFLPLLSTRLKLTEKLPLLISGQSFGGLCAVYAVLSQPAVFDVALALSGSYWWPAVENCVAAGQIPDWLNARIAEQSPSAQAVGHFWLGAGDAETDMRERSQYVTARLQQAGYQASYQEFRGGHDLLCWREAQLRGLAQLLRSTLSSNASQQR